MPVALALNRRTNQPGMELATSPTGERHERWPTTKADAPRSYPGGMIFQHWMEDLAESLRVVLQERWITADPSVSGFQNRDPYGDRKIFPIAPCIFDVDSSPIGTWQSKIYVNAIDSTGFPALIRALHTDDYWVRNSGTGDIGGLAAGGAYEFVAAEPSRQLVPQLSQELIDRLAYLASLQANWDGEGSAPVSQFAIDKIRSLLLEAYALGGESLPIPFIGPTRDGMLVAEWKTDAGKELILDVLPDETSPGFLLVEPQASGEEQETEAEIGDEWPIERIIRQLLAN